MAASLICDLVVCQNFYFLDAIVAETCCMISLLEYVRSGGSVFCVNFGKMCDVVWFDPGLLLLLPCWTPGDAWSVYVPCREFGFLLSVSMMVCI